MLLTKRAIAILLSAILIIATAGCSTSLVDDNEDIEVPTFKPKATQATTEPTTIVATSEPANLTGTTTPNTSRFENTFYEYSEDLCSLTPTLIEDYYSEIYALSFEEDVEPYSLIKEKENQLFRVFNEGLSEFVKIMNETDSDYNEYDYWESKLQDVYDQQLSILEDGCSTAISEDFDY